MSVVRLSLSLFAKAMGTVFRPFVVQSYNILFINVLNGLLFIKKKRYRPRMGKGTDRESSKTRTGDGGSVRTKIYDRTDGE